jgi:hypothetical protein
MQISIPERSPILWPGSALKMTWSPKRRKREKKSQVQYIIAGMGMILEYSVKDGVEATILFKTDSQGKVTGAVHSQGGQHPGDPDQEHTQYRAFSPPTDAQRVLDLSACDFCFQQAST